MEKIQVSQGEFNQLVSKETDYQRFVQGLEPSEAKQVAKDLVGAQYSINPEMVNEQEMD